MQMQGKTAIVTGAARGLGRAYAEALAREGANVVAGDVRACDDTVAAISKAGGKAISVSLDVADLASCKAMAEKAFGTYGRIDALVNNAALYGGLKGGKFDELDEGQWDRVMQVNVKGVWNCCKAVVPYMRKGGGGSNLASLASRLRGAYHRAAAAKAA